MRKNKTSVPRVTRARRSEGAVATEDDIDRVTSGVSNLALSVRSGTSVGREFTTSTGSRVVVPYTLFEFGFPRPSFGNQLPKRPQFVDERGEAFMQSEIGQHLRALERRYSAVLRQFIIRSVRVSGSSVLVLGSGSSKAILPLLRRRPKSVVFCDTSQPALDTMKDNIDDTGLSTFVDCSYVCCDAFSCISSQAPASIDLVIGVKCLGAVFSSDPDKRNTAVLLEELSPILTQDASVVVDHHVAFSETTHGSKIVDIVPLEYSDLATIAGRYDTDVSYTADVVAPGYDQVASLLGTEASHGIQEWKMFMYRCVPPPVPPVVTVRGTSRPLAPTPFPFPKLLDWSPIADARIPVNAKGTKRIATMSDVGGHRIDRALPKFDGVPGVVAIKENIAVFLGSTYRFSRRLPVKVEPPVEMMGEVVKVSGTGDAVVVITGLLAVGDTRADPLSLGALSQVEGLVAQMSSAGFVINSPDMIRCLRYDAVELVTSDRRTCYLPVDGVHVELAGRTGVFFKTASSCTVDLDPAVAGETLREAYKSAVPGVIPEISSVLPDGEICEYARDTRKHKWTAVKLRRDKRKSDKVGSVAQTALTSPTS